MRLNHYAESGVVAQIVDLATGTLNQTEKYTISQLIGYLLGAMQHGHSCISLKEFCSLASDDETITPKINLIQLIRILDKSELSSIYMLDEQANDNNKVAIPIRPLVIVTQMKRNRNSEPDGLLYLARYFTYELKIKMYLDKLNHPTKIEQRIIDQTMDGLNSRVKNGFPNQEATSCGRK